MLKLTKRESEVLHLLAEGYSYKMIAAMLNISTKTVGTHINHVYEKIGVHDKVSAVRWLWNRKQDVANQSVAAAA